MDSTRRSCSLNWRASPMRRARSSMPLDIAFEATSGVLGPCRAPARRRALDRAPAQAVDHAPRLRALAALLAVALHLAPHVLRRGMDRGDDLRRGFARAQCHALQVERRLDDEAVRDRGVSLLGEL